MDKYKPISCELYGMYEMAILRREPLRISWHGARGQDHVEALRLTNLRTRQHAEYMIAYNHFGERRVIRLDRVREAVPVHESSLRHRRH